jgi:hypothetical protein
MASRCFFPSGDLKGLVFSARPQPAGVNRCPGGFLKTVPAAAGVSRCPAVIHLNRAGFIFSLN